MTRRNDLALDIGGANLKAAHSSGRALSVPFPLWRQPQQLAVQLCDLVRSFPAYDRLALTMTGELCDCFETKAHGVRSILEAAQHIAPRHTIHVWGLDGRFHSFDEAWERTELAAAANWLALATVAARRTTQPGPALLIDIGSTTTDLIPLAHGQPQPLGRTDTERLQSGTLVYAGVRRTPVCALAAELPWRGRTIGLAAEWFATTLDVYLIRGEIAENPHDTDTADSRPATRAAARDRLARTIGADRQTFDETDARHLADAADTALLDRLASAAARIQDARGAPVEFVISGSGEFLARRLAERLQIEARHDARPGPIQPLSAVWSAAGSAAACAQALLELVAEPLP
ncbi:MAG: tetrahydromethanopterin-linked C1 transfer pathway [Isosphaeraceae bacterium]|nr:MAG: tetrahydromethanopterin-linked C1 transfer pathway [Isosphaeraceae bacterium]